MRILAFVGFRLAFISPPLPKARGRGQRAIVLCAPTPYMSSRLRLLTASSVFMQTASRPFAPTAKRHGAHAPSSALIGARCFSPRTDGCTSHPSVQAVLADMHSIQERLHLIVNVMDSQNAGQTRVAQASRDKAMSDMTSGRLSCGKRRSPRALALSSARPPVHPGGGGRIGVHMAWRGMAKSRADRLLPSFVRLVLRRRPPVCCVLFCCVDPSSPRL